MAEKGRVIAAAGIILYRWREDGGVEVLTATRQTEPWKGHTTVVFGGKIKPHDASVPHAARREAREETGQTLRVGIPRPLNVYGPIMKHYYLERNGTDLLTRPSSHPFGIDDAYIFIVYRAPIIDGYPTENREAENFRYETPLSIADGRTLPFEQARMIADFWNMAQHDDSFRNPKIAPWIYTPPV